MLRTRLIVGTVLAALTAGMLLLDERYAPWFPFLLATVLLLSLFGTVELVELLPPTKRPNRVLTLAGVILVVALNWAPIVRMGQLKWHLAQPAQAWWFVAQGFAAVVLLAFLVEMAQFRAPGGAVERIALAVWVVAYLGLLPSFLLQLRLGELATVDDELRRGTVNLALAIFVPKGCDIGAYFTGRLIGRHRMTPVLSPKKTWEGAAGGLTLAVAVAFGLNGLGPVIPGGAAGTVAFGLSVGLAGMLGDLAESLIKRDCERKDASQVVPGFGGILDVVDAILFAAPVVYWWLA
ncbi:MAG TPA: phosphatidate cytidylyltransferase [Gemmataceae bacterium]|jgi:phosphatidate cytidylyltransferase